MVSIILPVFNCAHQFRKGIPQLVDLLGSTGLEYEIIVVNDGSDESESVAEISAASGCIYIDNVVNLGKGAAVKRGIFAASGDVLIFMDGDFPFILTVITDMLAVFQNSSVEVVIGDRSLPGSRYPKISFARTLGSRLLSAIVTRFILKGLPDSQCGVKGFRRDIARSIFEKVTLTDFSFDVEVLFISGLRNHNLVRIPVQVIEQRESSVRIVRDGLLLSVGLLKILTRYIAGKYRK
ncbi:glycosyltransferase family 2 protein [Flavitalea antarctica]